MGKVLHRVPSSTGVVEVDDGETHVSPDEADLVFHLARYVLCRSRHESIPYVPLLPAKLVIVLYLVPIHEL